MGWRLGGGVFFWGGEALLGEGGMEEVYCSSKHLHSSVMLVFCHYLFCVYINAFMSVHMLKCTCMLA